MGPNDGKESNQLTEAPPAPRAHLLTRGKRLSGYLFWYILEVTMEGGLLPLVLVPICIHTAGETAVGQFLYALGIVSLVGLTPTKGLTNTLLRNLSGVAEERQPLLLRTSFGLATGVTAALAVVAMLGCLVGASTQRTSLEVSVWVAILVVAFAARNVLTIGSVDFSVSRKFGRRAFWRGLGAVLALAAVPGFYLLGEAGIPIGYALGHVAALAALLGVRRRLFLATPRFDRIVAGRVTTSWFVLSLGTFFLGSGRYVHRTVLGAGYTEDLVTVFYSGAAILSLCMMPVATLGLFGFQLLSAHKSRSKFSRGFLAWYSIAALLGVLVFYGIAEWIAPWPLRWLYAQQADRALQPMSIMAIGVALSVLMHASRPFVQKFASLQVLLVIGAVSLVAHLVAAATLIPRWGLTGAAWSYCIGSGVASLTWFCVFLVGFLNRPETDDQPGSVDELDPG